MRSLESYEMEIAFSPFGSPVASLAVYDRGDYYESIPADLSAGGSEYVYAGDFEYKRDCTTPEACTQWVRTSPRSVIPSLAGQVNSVPETLALTAIELASGWTLVPNATGVLLTGAVNINDATEENQRRAYTLAGNTPEQIEAVLQGFRENRPPVDPSLIEVTLSSDYRWITHVTIYVPARITDPYVDFGYSSFDTAQVTAPEDFVIG